MTDSEMEEIENRLSRAKQIKSDIRVVEYDIGKVEKEARFTLHVGETTTYAHRISFTKEAVLSILTRKLAELNMEFEAI